MIHPSLRSASLHCMAKVERAGAYLDHAPWTRRGFYTLSLPNLHRTTDHRLCPCRLDNLVNDTRIEGLCLCPPSAEERIPQMGWMGYTQFEEGGE